MFKSHFEMFAAYNAWANTRLYAAAARVSEAQYREDRGAFFKSLHGTLNHILVGDRVWMRRFTGEGEAPKRLDAILFEDLSSLRTAREAEDRRILAYVRGLDEARLAGTIRYRLITRPEDVEQPVAPALAHFFNHQTRHRGQAHGLLTNLGAKAPELDLLFYQREIGR
ncbi:MAG: damage-inducible protein DinB [Alphaproteobacteria bacterium]|nr:damage-inducible protein DinB [Alphaproteobacteria bacterium]